MNRKIERLAKLRHRAEDALHQNKNISSQSTQEVDILTEELRVHRLELEMQVEELQQSYDALQSAQQRYTRLFDSAPVAYLVLDMEGRILDANLLAAHMLDVKRKELYGRFFSEFVATAFQDIFSRSLHMLRFKREAQTTELQLQRKDGKRIPILINTNAPEKHAHEFFLTFTNIAKLKHNKETLEQALLHEKDMNQLLQTVLSILAPEFRSPLNTILSSLEVFYKHGERLTERKKLQLYQTMRNLVWYLKDTLQGNHYSEDATHVKLEAFDLIAFAGQILNDMQAIGFNGSKIILDVASSRERAMVLWDANLFRRIFMNMLIYVLKNSNEVVHCQLEIKEYSIRLLIEDKNNGIHEQDLEAFFKEMQESRSSEFIEGRGNSLFVAYEAVKAHGGLMRYEYRNNVTSFIVDLPRQIPNQTSQSTTHVS